jgi:catechol 2,3-dioxygenase-like lactoylglutathione lyase family enzyme
MALRLDHLVILVRDLDTAVSDYQQLGFQVTPGGTHADGLTRNALVIFADGTYLELIAFVDPHDSRDNVWGWRRHLAAGGGLIDYCLASDDLARDVAAMRERGLTVEGPTEGGRKRPDGAEIRWRSARIWQAGRELPFLIEDVTPRDLRVPHDSTQHPNGVTGIHELTIAVADLARAATQFAAVTHTRAAPIITNARLDAEMAAFRLGDHTIILAAAESTHSPIRQHIETVGLGPYEVTLLADGDARARSLDARLTHGARLRLG